jgi:hypothetical protein
VFFPDSELPSEVSVTGCKLTRSISGEWFLSLRRGDVITGADKVLATLFKRLQLDHARRQAKLTQAQPVRSGSGLDCILPPLPYTVDREGNRIPDVEPS